MRDARRSRVARFLPAKAGRREGRLSSAEAGAAFGCARRADDPVRLRRRDLNRWFKINFKNLNLQVLEK